MRVHFLLALVGCFLIVGCGGGRTTATNAQSETAASRKPRKPIAELKIPDGYKVVDMKMRQDDWDAFFANGAPGAYVEHIENGIRIRQDLVDLAEGGAVVTFKKTFTESNLEIAYPKEAFRFTATNEPGAAKRRFLPSHGLFVVYTPALELRSTPDDRRFRVGNAEVAADRKITEAKSFKGVAGFLEKSGKPASPDDSVEVVAWSAWLSKEVPLGGLVERGLLPEKPLVKLVAYGKGKTE